MEEQVIGKKLNVDFIPVVHKEEGDLRYIEYDIEKTHEDLISQIEKFKDNINISLMEIQDSFSQVFTGNPVGYSYCLPHNYCAAFVDSATYPKLYTQDELIQEINKIRNDFISRKKESIDKEKEIGKIDDKQYIELLNNIEKDAEEKVAKRFDEIRNTFAKESIRYIQACDFYTTINNIKADEKNLMHSTEIIGWTKYKYSINSDVNVFFKSNFCYGRSAYFHITVVYKGVEILSYPKLVQYYYANMLDFVDCTESYKPDRQNWKLALSFVVDQSNWVAEEEEAFVQKWIIDGTNEMITGLNEILVSPSLVIDRLINSALDDSTLYAVRNITKDEIAEYKIFRDEMTIAFQAEKITGSLFLIPNLKKLCCLYDRIQPIIDDIERLNRDFFHKLDDAINSLSKKIDAVSNRIDEIQTEYDLFRREHHQDFSDYRRFLNRNKNMVNVCCEYFILHPEFKILFNQDNEYKKEIESLTIEYNRLIKFIDQLKRCAQRICDYGLVSSTNDNYLSTQVSDLELFSLIDGDFIMSKDKRRLYKLKKNQKVNIVIPDTIKVICDNALSNNGHIQRIHFPNGLKVIGSCCFQCCSDLQEIVLSNSVETIGTDNFYACKSLKRVVISSSMKVIPSWSFNNCTSLEEIVIPHSIRRIGDSAFKGCSSLISIKLPDSIDDVGNNIFEGCEKLLKIYIPKNEKTKFEKILWQYKDKLVGINNI